MQILSDTFYRYLFERVPFSLSVAAKQTLTATPAEITKDRDWAGYATIGALEERDGSKSIRDIRCTGAN